MEDNELNTFGNIIFKSYPDINLQCKVNLQNSQIITLR